VITTPTKARRASYRRIFIRRGGVGRGQAPPIRIYACISTQIRKMEC